MRGTSPRHLPHPLVLLAAAVEAARVLVQLVVWPENSSQSKALARFLHSTAWAEPLVEGLLHGDGLMVKSYVGFVVLFDLAS